MAEPERVAKREGPAPKTERCARPYGGMLDCSNSRGKVEVKTPKGGYMQNFVRESIPGLIGDLKDEIKTFVREEVELAKKEMSEKLSKYGRNSVALLAGGFVAYAGLIVLLVGVGFVVGFGFQKLGLDPTLAIFIGLGIIGLLAMGGGAVAILQGAKAIAKTSPVPEKAIDAAKQVTGTLGVATTRPQRAEDPRSSEHIHALAKGTADRVKEKKEELVLQLSPRQLKNRAVLHMKEHPVIWGAAALGGVATVAGGLLFGRKFLTRGGLGTLKLLASGSRR